MEDLLTHFLGRCDPEDMIVKSVGAISGDTLETSPLSRAAVDLGVSRHQRAAGLLAAGRSARDLAPMVMAIDLPDAAALSLCRVSGFTHAALAQPAG